MIEVSHMTRHSSKSSKLGNVNTVTGRTGNVPIRIDFQKCREKIAASLNEFCNLWCKREHVECDALKDWKLNIFKLID